MLFNFCSCWQHMTGTWNIDDMCRVMYSDGLDLVARILLIDETRQTCIVRFLGFETIDEIKLAYILPLASDNSS